MVAAQVVVLDRTAAPVVYIHTASRVIVDVVSVQRGIAAFPDLYPDRALAKSH